MILTLRTGDKLGQRDLIARLIAMQYTRNEQDFQRGTSACAATRSTSSRPNTEMAARRAVRRRGRDAATVRSADRPRAAEDPRFTVYPSSHYVTPRDTVLRAIETIKDELRERLEFFHREGKLVEAQRLEQRTRFDLEMQELGFCKGIENYSRHFPARRPASRRRRCRLPAARRADAARRIARADRPAQRHVQRRPGAQGKPRQLRLPAAVGARQPAAQVPRVRAQDAPGGVRVRDAGRLRAARDGPDRRTGGAPDRARRSGDRSAPGKLAGRRRAHRDQRA
jgi:hypothetical protein